MVYTILDFDPMYLIDKKNRYLCGFTIILLLFDLHFSKQLSCTYVFLPFFFFQICCLDGHIHSLNTGDDGQLVGLLHRIIDLEEADRETMHLLVFLLVQFLSRSDQVCFGIFSTLLFCETRDGFFMMPW